MRLVSLIVFIALASPAFADDVGGSTGFKCPGTGNLISIGASRYEVRTKCREPDDSITTMEERTVVRRVRRLMTAEERRARMGKADRVLRSDELEIEELVSRLEEVQVERWTFDFGANRFLRFLTFVNGVLVEIGDGPKGVAERQ